MTGGGGVLYADLTQLIEDTRLRGSSLLAAIAIGDHLAASLATMHVRTAVAGVRLAVDASGQRPVGSAAVVLDACERLSQQVEVGVRQADRDRLLRWIGARELSAFDSLVDPHLFETIANARDLDTVDFAFLFVMDSSFRDCSLNRSRFDYAMIEDSDLSRAGLARTTWRGASLVGCSLAGAELIDAALDDAVFVNCDLRGVDLSRVNLGSATTRGACFIRCDLRETNWHGRSIEGAYFEDCRCFGIHGVPHIDRIEIERPDLSPAGDGTRIGRPDDLFQLWARP